MKTFGLIRSRVIALVLIFSALFFMLVQYEYEHNVKHLLLETEGTTYSVLTETMASVLALNLAFGLREENKLAIKNYCDKTPLLAVLALYDEEGKLVASCEKPRGNKHTLNIDKTLSDPQSGQVIGRVNFIFVSNALFEAEKENAAFLWRFLTVSVAVLLLMLWMLDRIFGPLDRTVKWIKAFDPKSSELQAMPRTSSLEIQTIQEAMNDMFKRIRYHTEQLDSFNRLLDMKVRMRTEALSRTNTLLNNEIRQRKATEEALKEANVRLTELSRIDVLTGIANRRFFQETLDDRWGLSLRERKPLSLVICDIDHFKKVNDHYGHLAGDTVLKEVARILMMEIKRGSDMVARYGGEEFAFILFDTEDRIARSLVQRIQQKLAAVETFPPPAEHVGAVTLSFGLCTVVPYRDGNAEHCLAAADKALYRAKEAGRNRLMVTDSLG